MFRLFKHRKSYRPYFFCCLFISASCSNLISQSTKVVDTIDAQYVRVIAGEQYESKPAKEFWFGKHYRREWITPVKIKIAYLDTLACGLTPYQKGGGRQTKTLRLRDTNEKEYVLRSIDKDYSGAIPEIFHESFVEKIVNDQVSTAHPFAAVTIPPLAEAAGIYHTKPVIYFIPQQKQLENEYADYGNQLFLFEQRPDENWEEALKFGASKKIISTHKLLENLLDRNDHQVHQQTFIRTRLFDMFIGDWGRHEDQWRWATIDYGETKIYKAIPRDRDQVYTLYDGLLPKMLTFISHQETFGHTIKNLEGYNFPARNLDRFMANEMTLNDWKNGAKEIRENISDEKIESAIKELPPEIYSFSGPEIIGKLKSRKAELVNFADEYYHLLAREVDITGTKQDELFHVSVINEQLVEIKIFAINENNKSVDSPFYKRLFRSSETKEIRLYGIAGNDRFEVDAKVKSPVLIRIIGGPEYDEYLSNRQQKHGVIIYDNYENSFEAKGGLKKKLSDNPFVHFFQYDHYVADKKGFFPILYYSTEDRIFAGLAYTIAKQHWRKYPYGAKHRLAYHYSFSEGSYSINYKSHFTKLLGEWNGNLSFNYDNIRWTNYYGIGNETLLLTKDRDFNRVRTRDLQASAGIDHLFAFYHHFNAGIFYNSVKLLNDTLRFLTYHQPFNKKVVYGREHFVGLLFQYRYARVDNPMLPTKGVEWDATIQYTRNLQQADSAFITYSTAVNYYLPFSKSFSARIRAGAATLNGNPQFYQLNMLGGSETLRGYRRSRFYGKTMAFNQNELYFIRDVRSNIFNGKAGLMALLDAGRVWYPGTISTNWHFGYGGGIILSPFNQLTLYITYAFSKEDGDFGIRFYHSF